MKALDQLCEKDLAAAIALTVSVDLRKILRMQLHSLNFIIYHQDHDLTFSVTKLCSYFLEWIMFYLGQNIFVIRVKATLSLVFRWST